jgi:hypothetical protein
MSGAVVIQVVIGVAAALVLGPVIAFCLFPRSVRAWFEAGPEGVDAAAPETAREAITALREMGFQPLGVKVEKPPLRRVLRELSFVAADRQCYAAIGAVRPRSRLYFYTPFPDGGLALTSNGAFPKISSPNVAQRSFRGAGPRDLLERHREALASLGRKGEVSAAPEARIEATYAYYATPEVRRVLGRTAALLLVWLVALEWFLIGRNLPLR